MKTAPFLALVLTWTVIPAAVCLWPGAAAAQPATVAPAAAATPRAWDLRGTAFEASQVQAVLGRWSGATADGRLKVTNAQGQTMELSLPDKWEAPAGNTWSAAARIAVIQDIKVQAGQGTVPIDFVNKDGRLYLLRMGPCDVRPPGEEPLPVIEPTPNPNPDPEIKPAPKSK